MKRKYYYLFMGFVSLSFLVRSFIKGDPIKEHLNFNIFGVFFKIAYGMMSIFFIYKFFNPPNKYN